MAWVLLPVDYTDATWDGLKQYAMINNADGTVSFQDVTVYANKENSFFGALDANQMNDAINTLMTTLNGAGSGAHNAIYRGKDLGDTVTAEQYAAIAAGTFDGLYIGDSWTIAGITYRIAAFDYYLRTGDTELTDHHVTLVPDTVLYNATMNATNTTDGGYIGSLMYTANLEQAKTIINAAFGGHVLTHRQYLTNAVTGGMASGGAWVDSAVELMNAIMLYGSGVFSPVSDGVTIPANYTLGKSQLPLFQTCPDSIVNRISYWLRDAISDADFAVASSTGIPRYSEAVAPEGVRPVFSIFGGD